VRTDRRRAAVMVWTDTTKADSCWQWSLEWAAAPGADGSGSGGEIPGGVTWWT